MFYSALYLISLASICTLQGRADVSIHSTPGQAEPGFVEIHGVGADDFNMDAWKTSSLHFLPDVRSPLIAPRLTGTFRNIYAPSIVQVPGGWRVFYGAWDGVSTGNDRIYSVFTTNFIDFGDRTIEIEHGTFIHVCNVSAVQTGDQSWRLACTAYPDSKELNKPAVFYSPDGKNWNGHPAPYPATLSDLISMEGYPEYPQAEINGVNVLSFEADVFRLYFCNFKAMKHVYMASSHDGKSFRYEGTCLDTGHMVNDVKKLMVKGQSCYLMALHANTDRLWYAMSGDGRRFGPEQELASSLGNEDKYIVAIGWVTDGPKLRGFLYGAGAVPELNRNRIFARWLQKRISITDQENQTYEATAGLGPDRQLISLKGRKEFEGRIEVFAEDGKTRLGQSAPIKIISGAIYTIGRQKEK